MYLNRSNKAKYSSVDARKRVKIYVNMLQGYYYE